MSQDDAYFHIHQNNPIKGFPLEQAINHKIANMHITAFVCLIHFMPDEQNPLSLGVISIEC